MYKKICFLISFLQLGFWICGQIYQPIDTADYQQRKVFLAKMKQKDDIIIKDLKSKYDGKTATELARFYKEFYTDFEKEVKNKEYTFRSPFEDTIHKIIEKIQLKNPQTQSLDILIAKDNSPNAFCIADGTFIINMGLFNWMDNEDQIASILCHEIAHKIKQHSINAILAQIEGAKSEKETLKGINGQSNGKHDRAFDFVKNQLYKRLGEKRKNEIQADSLGYVLYSNTDFRKEEYMNAIKNLQDFDSISPRELKLETYKKLYDLPQQPFKEKWMKKEDFSLYNYGQYHEKMDRDSLSTHPEIEMRIALLEKEFPELKSKVQPIEGNDHFKQLKKIAKMEILPNLYQSEDYGVGIYVAMQLLQDDYEEKYVTEWFGKLFQKIYDSRKNYTLNRYLDRIEPKEQSESYQQFLNFMWNLNLEEIKTIADFYNKKEP